MSTDLHEIIEQIARLRTEESLLSERIAEIEKESQNFTTAQNDQGQSSTLSSSDKTSLNNAFQNMLFELQGRKQEIGRSLQLMQEEYNRINGAP